MPFIHPALPIIGRALGIKGRSGTLARMKSKFQGFTLVEMLVTIAVVAVLAGLAVPSFQTLMVSRNLDSVADTLASDFRYTRSEAIKRTTFVSICASSSGTACAGSLWKDGWIVFIDDNGNGAFDAGDAIIRVQQTMSGIGSIASTNPINDRTTFVFQPSGWSKTASQTFLVASSGNAGVPARLVCVSNKGRAAIRDKGETTC